MGFGIVYGGSTKFAQNIFIKIMCLGLADKILLYILTDMLTTTVSNNRFFQMQAKSETARWRMKWKV